MARASRAAGSRVTAGLGVRPDVVDRPTVQRLEGQRGRSANVGNAGWVQGQVAQACFAAVHSHEHEGSQPHREASCPRRFEWALRRQDRPLRDAGQIDAVERRGRPQTQCSENGPSQVDRAARCVHAMSGKGVDVWPKDDQRRLEERLLEGLAIHEWHQEALRWQPRRSSPQRPCRCRARPRAARRASVPGRRHAHRQRGRRAPMHGRDRPP